MMAGVCMEWLWAVISSVEGMELSVLINNIGYQQYGRQLSIHTNVTTLKKTDLSDNFCNKYTVTNRNKYQSNKIPY